MQLLSETTFIDLSYLYIRIIFDVLLDIYVILGFFFFLLVWIVGVESHIHVITLNHIIITLYYDRISLLSHIVNTHSSNCLVT